MSGITSFDYASSNEDGGIMGRDSPAALLDMLAEVASRTLHSEKKEMKSLLASQCKTKDFIRHKVQETYLTVQQLLSMPISQLVKQFSILTCDELKKQYSYTCTLVKGCEQKYTSFASEGKARKCMKAHLVEHLELLKTDEQAYNNFTAKTIKYRNFKTNLQNKKVRLQHSKKPQGTVNKENKDILLEKCANHSYKILSNNINFKQCDKQEVCERSENFGNSDMKNTEQTNIKVLGDHSYFERLKDETSNEIVISASKSVLDDSSNVEDIVVMVVDADSVHMKEYSQIKNKISDNSNQQDSTIYISELSSWREEECNRRMEVSSPVKPKGKAKFIGTSKEERELALAFMDRIKKKGNPTGSNLQCHICDPPRSFTAPTTLVSHYRSHAGIKPYECRICRAVFTRRHSLKYHMLIHQNQTRFTCADCGKKFRHPSHFREHRRRHTGESPFGCDDCGQRFKTRNTYKRHLKTRHGKVLTTTGELLFLSKEDFEKVRTNKKKKADSSSNIRVFVDEDNLATRTIVDYQDNGDQQEMNNGIPVEYIIAEDNTSHEIKDTKDTIEVVDKYFDNYEVCPIPLLDKTEYIEEEISLDNNNSSSVTNSIQKEIINKKFVDLREFQDVSNNLEVDKLQEGSMVYNNHVNNNGITYKYLNNDQSVCIDECSKNVVISSENVELENEMNGHLQCIEIEKNYNDNELGKNEENIESAVNTQMVKDMQIKSVIADINCNTNTVNERYESHMVISQNDIEYDDLNKYTNMFTEISHEGENKVNTYNNNSEINNSCHYQDDSHEFLQGHQILTEQAININNCEYETSDLMKNKVTEYAKSGSEEQNQINETFNEIKSNTIVIQDKCIRTLPSNLAVEEDKSTKKVVFLRSMIQNNKQNTILLLPSSNLKNGVLHITASNNSFIKLKKQIVSTNDN